MYLGSFQNKNNAALAHDLVLLKSNISSMLTASRYFAAYCTCGVCRLTQRWEASLWLAGKQMYLGGFQDEDDAARAYDLAALACKGLSVPTNFPAEGYTDSLAEIGGSSRVRPFLNCTMQLQSPCSLCENTGMRQMC